MGAGMNPRPLEPAAACPQAGALTPGAQVKRRGQLSAAAAPPPAAPKSPSAAGSAALPGGGGAGAIPRRSAPQPQPVPPRPGATAARRGSGRTGRSLGRVTGGSALPSRRALEGILRERLPLGLPASLQLPLRGMRSRRRVQPESRALTPRGIRLNSGSPEARGGTRAEVGWETFLLIGPRPMEDLKLAHGGTLG